MSGPSADLPFGLWYSVVFVLFPFAPAIGNLVRDTTAILSG